MNKGKFLVPYQVLGNQFSVAKDYRYMKGYIAHSKEHLFLSVVEKYRQILEEKPTLSLLLGRPTYTYSEPEKFAPYEKWEIRVVIYQMFNSEEEYEMHLLDRNILLPEEDDDYIEGTRKKAGLDNLL